MSTAFAPRRTALADLTWTLAKTAKAFGMRIVMSTVGVALQDQLGRSHRSIESRVWASTGLDERFRWKRAVRPVKKTDESAG